MKRSWMVLLVIAIFAMVFVTGCKDDSTDPDLDAIEILMTYLDANGMDVDALFAGWIKAAADIVDETTYTIPDYYVMDIRTGDSNSNDIVDYHDGHIEGAVLSSLGSIVVDAAQADKPILVVCYTGQSAGHAVMALRLSGYTDAAILKWGMSGWHSDFDKWTPNVAQLDHANWVAAPGLIEDAEVFGYPEWEVDATDGEAILEARVTALLEGGFKGVGALDTDTMNGALDNPGDYFLNNYWAADDVETYGNITGAYRIKPLVLENLDPNSTVVTYCWSGQTSSMMTAYLTVLGYDAKSLKFGANGMIYDDLTGHKWSASMDYPYEVTE